MADRLRLGFLANHHILTKKLDTDSLLPDLISSGLISFEERELISHEATGSLKTDRLLTILHRRGTVNPDIFSQLFELLSNESVTAGQLLDDVLKQIKADSCNDGVVARFAYSSGVLKVGDSVSLRNSENDIINALTVSEVLPQLVSYGIVNLSENDLIRLVVPLVADIFVSNNLILYIVSINNVNSITIIYALALLCNMLSWDELISVALLFLCTFHNFPFGCTISKRKIAVMPMIFLSCLDQSLCKGIKQRSC